MVEEEGGGGVGELVPFRPDGVERLEGTPGALSPASGTTICVWTPVKGLLYKTHVLFFLTSVSMTDELNSDVHAYFKVI